MTKLASLFNFFNKKNTTIDDLKWQYAVENSNIGVWDWDASTDKVFYSKESKNLIGYSNNELENTANDWNSRVYPDDREKYYRDFNAHLNGEIDTYTNEHRILCKDGSYKWILDHGKVISKNKKGKPIRVIGTHIDITERKNSERLAKKNLETIETQNKKLYNFTHIVSHNLKNHIGNLKTVLDIYEEEENKEEKNRMLKYLKDISSSLSSTMYDLNKIVSVQNKKTYNNVKVNISSSILKTIKNLELNSKKSKVTINNKIKKDIFIIGNEAYFESIFHNIILNAIKYSHPDRLPEIIISSSTIDDRLEIVIADNGIGIDTNKYKNQIFEMYQTFHETKRSDSKGVGLYLTKLQVEELGGKITLNSELGIGTKICLSFPK